MPAPANDLCVDAQVISSLPFSLTAFDNTDATSSVDDPNLIWMGDGDVATAAPAYRTTWYSYTPAVNERLHVTLSVTSVIFAVLTGACGSLTELLSWRSAITFDVVAGTTYRFLIGSTSDVGHTFDLSITTTTTIPSNQLLQTALVVQADSPVSVTLDNVADNGSSRELWFKFVAPPLARLVSVFGFGDLVGYNPTTTAYTTPINIFDPGTAVAPSSAINVPLQVAVTPAETYWFRVRKFSVSPVVSTLTLSVTVLEELDAPIGSIFIPDDTPGFPAVILSAIDGTVLQVLSPFPAGESAFVLDDGTLLTQDIDAGTVQLYDSALALIATVPFALSGASGGGITGNKTNRFYVCNATSWMIRTVNPDGSFGGTTWVVGSGSDERPAAIAVSPDESTLYYCSSGQNKPIKRWDLVNDVALSNLAAAPTLAHFQRRQLLCLEDGAVLAMWTRDSALEVKVYRYNPDGSVASTYDFTSEANSESQLRPDNQIALALDDPTSFWVWLKRADGVSRFKNIRVSDGAVLTSFDAMQYEVGKYRGPATATPSAFFGHSESCPFVILPYLLAAPVGEVEDLTPVIGPYVWVHWKRRIPDLLPPAGEAS